MELTAVALFGSKLACELCPYILGWGVSPYHDDRIAIPEGIYRTTR